MKKLFALALTTALLFTATPAKAAYFDVSPWAVDTIRTARSLGIIPETLVGADFPKNIDREDFTMLIIRVYDRINGIPYVHSFTSTRITPFTDVWNDAVGKAYELGIVGGVSATKFAPRSSITRQEAAVMIANLQRALNVPAYADVSALNVFSDQDKIADWAKNSAAAVVSSGYMSGDAGKFSPTANLTYEQAISIALRVFRDNASNIFPNAITITSHTDRSYIPYGEIKLTWTRETPDPYVKYYVIRLTDSDNKMFASEYNDLPVVTDSSATLARSNVYNNSETILAVRDSNGVISEPVRLFVGKGPDKAFYNPDKDIYQDFAVGSNSSDSASNSASNSAADSASNWGSGSYSGGNYIGNGIYGKYNYTSAEEASKDMKTVSFPVWKLKGSTKVESTAKVKVNKDVADDVVAIFTEIFNGPEKFPIKDVGGYDWRSVNSSGNYSAHNYGLAIDINSDENYCVYPNGRVVGSFWKPGENPYSITENGDVVKAFRNHGWYWLGNTWNSVRDYMHFSSNGM